MKSGTAAIDAIVVEDRARRDLGDLQPLMDSIARLNLLHPIVVDGDLRLIAGQRRLEACRRLGWTEVPTRVAHDMGDAAEQLAAERDENTCRLDMKASELYALGKRIEEMERPKAADRQRAALKQGDEAPSGSKEPNGAKGRTYETVAPAVGMSTPTWKRLKHVGDRAADGDEAATEVLDKIDNGEATITGGYTKLRQRDVTEAPDAKPARSKLPAAKRAEQIRDLAESGHRAAQIADKLDVSIEYVRDLARKFEITLPDAAMGKTRALDPHRIVSETVLSLEGSAMSLDLIDLDALEGVDPEVADQWATSLSQSLKSLNRLRNQLKEMARVTV